MKLANVQENQQINDIIEQCEIGITSIHAFSKEVYLDGTMLESWSLFLYIIFSFIILRFLFFPPISSSWHSSTHMSKLNYVNSNLSTADLLSPCRNSQRIIIQNWRVLVARIGGGVSTAYYIASPQKNIHSSLILTQQLRVRALCNQA